MLEMIGAVIGVLVAAYIFTRGVNDMQHVRTYNEESANALIIFLAGALVVVMLLGIAIIGSGG